MARHGLADAVRVVRGHRRTAQGPGCAAAAIEAMDDAEFTLALVGPHGWGSDGDGREWVPRWIDSVRRFAGSVSWMGPTSICSARRPRCVACRRGPRASDYPVLEAMAAGHRRGDHQWYSYGGVLRRGRAAGPARRSGCTGRGTARRRRGSGCGYRHAPGGAGAGGWVHLGLHHGGA